MLLVLHSTFHLPGEKALQEPHDFENKSKETKAGKIKQYRSSIPLKINECMPYHITNSPKQCPAAIQA